MFINQYLSEVKESIYRITFSEDDIKKIKKYIIHEKNIYSKPLTIDDLYLIRITTEENIPRNMTYFPIDYRNGYHYIRNPFCFILGFKEFNMKGYENIDFGGEVEQNSLDKNKIVSYWYRDTKHFSINGLASNIYNFGGINHIFDKGDFIIIEPLKNRIKDSRLVVINPVDTFFDLHDSEMKIGDDAICIINDSLYQRLDSSTLENIGDRKVFLFHGNASTATDIVLLSLGVLPQHSVNQTRLEPEYYFVDKKEITDEQYIEDFQRLIEDVSQAYLHQSYLNLPPEIIKWRKEHWQEMVGVPGILHSETPYFMQERKKDEQARIKAYQDYMLGMIPLVTDKVPEESIRTVISSIEDDVKKRECLPIEEQFFSTYHNYEDILLNIMLDLSYPTFQKYTKEFNQKRLSKINKNRIG